MSWTWIPLPRDASALDIIAALNTRMNQLQRTVAMLEEATGDFADGDTTPDVSDFSIWSTANTGATSITALDGVTGPARKTVIVGDANTTFVHSSTFVLQGAGNFAASSGNVIEFITTDGDTWYELSRRT